MLFMKKYSALFLLCTLTFTACKKEGGKAQSNDEKYESKLPNYGSVNLKEVFSLKILNLQIGMQQFRL